MATSGWSALPADVDAAVTTDAPRRVLDTRVGLSSSVGRLQPGRVLRLHVDDVSQRVGTAVMLNLTSDQAEAPGFVSAWPCDEDPTDTSILNVFPGRAIPNAVALAYGSAGLCFSSTTPVHLIADLTSVTTSGDFMATAPARRFDSRDGRRFSAGEERRFRIGGRGDIPAGAAAAAFNVTVVDPAADGFVLVEPCDGDSAASTMNFRRGEIVPHFTFSALADGDVCVTSLVDTDLVIDVFGWMGADSEIELISPNRALDTRTGFGGTRGALRDGEVAAVQVAGRAGTKRGATNAVLNIVGVDAAALGFVNAWPCDEPEPNSSVLNLWPGAVRANQIVVALSDSGEVCLSAMLVDASRVHVVVDVVGYTGGVGDPVPPEEPPSVDPPPPTNPPPTDPPVNPPSSSRFETLPAGSALPSGAECAARVRPAAEVRPENAAQNQTRGVIPAGGTEWLDFQDNWASFDRVDGDFVGTTDEILQWAACKWGIDEDVVRAQIVTESWWKMSANGDGGDSFGLGQVRVPYHGNRPGAGDNGAFQNDNAIRSSAYNVDYTYAVWRGCFEQQYNWLGDTRGDLWGCAGSWFSGQFRDPAGLEYIGVVQGHVNDRTWETPSFING